MNLKSLEYFIEVAKDLNMTAAAQRLYISQQALSVQMQKLEQYYGVTLFERQPKLQLTYAGQQLLQGAEKLIQESIAIENNLTDLSRKRAGILRIGIPSYRAAECFPLIMSEYTQRWPKVSIHLEETASTNILQMLCDGALDVGIITPFASERQGLTDQIEFTFLMDDSTYLICSDELLHRCFGSDFQQIRERALQGTDLRDFAQLPFMLHKHPMRLRRVADECFNNAGFKPEVFIETSNTELMLSLYPCHVGGFFCRRSRIHVLMAMFEDCNAFPIRYEGVPHETAVYFARRKGSRIPTHILDFERLMQKAWRQIAEY